MGVSGIISIRSWHDGKGTICDRCGAFIKNVTSVGYSDNTTMRYGSECINKILGSDTSLQKLVQKNLKLLTRYQDMFEILSRTPESMPVGSEYYGSGLYFIADSIGNDLHFDGHSFFHPIMNWERNTTQKNYHQESAESFKTKELLKITKELPKITKEIERITKFLAKHLTNPLTN